MANDQQFCLRWNNHQTTLVEIFDKLLSNDSLVDCTLAAEGQYMRAHKVLLSACSPYFELILSQHNDKHPIIILKDVTFRELKALMDYMYRGEVNVSQDQLAALLKVAENLQIKGLSDSGGGGTEPKEKPPEKRPLPPPPPAQQPTPIIPRPGLTIEHRRSNQLDLSQHSPSALDGSPVPRKRKRTRRRSSDDESSLGHTPIESHHDSSSRESSSLSIPPNVASTPLSKSVAVIPEPPPVLDRTDHILPEPAQPIHQDIVHKTEPNTEMLLEPKHEYPDDDMNEDSVEDLTLEDDMNDLDQSQAGPSGEGSSSQGFTPWHMATDRSTDEVFMQAQEAVGAQRDSQDDRVEKVWLYEEDLGMKPEGSEPDQFEATDYNVMDCEKEDIKPTHVEPARFASVPEGTASDSLTPKVSEQSTIHIVQPSLVLGLHTQDESEPTHVEPAGSASVPEGTARDSLAPKVSEQSTIHIVQPSLMMGLHTPNDHLHLVHRNVACLNFKSKNDVYSKSPVSTKIQFRKIAPKPSSSNIDAPVDAVKAPNTTSTSLNLVKTINKSDSLRTNLLKEPAKEKIKVARKRLFHKKLVNVNVRRCTKTTRSTSSNSKSNIQSDDECNAQLSPMRLRSNKRKLANTLSTPSTTSSAATISKSNIAPRPILPVPSTPVSTSTIPSMPLLSNAATSTTNVVGSEAPPQSLTYAIPVQTTANVHPANVQQFPSVEIPYAAQPQMPSNMPQFGTPNIVQQYQMSSNIVQTFQTQSCITPIINTSIMGQEFETSNSFQHCEMHSSTVQQIQTSNIVGMNRFESPSSLVQQTQTSNVVGIHQVTTQTNTVQPVQTTVAIYSQDQIVNDPVQTPRTSQPTRKSKRSFCKILPRPPLAPAHSSSPPGTRTYKCRKHALIENAAVKITNQVSHQSATRARPIPLKCFRCFKHFSSNKSLLQHLHSHFS